VSEVRRGEVWTAGGAEDARKPRPVVIVQDDRFDATGSVIVCPLTTNPTDAPHFRPRIEPTSRNGLREVSRLMVDKLTSTPRTKARERVGVLEPEHLVAMERAILVFLGIAE
jgi:mRNA interferase MazF